MDGIIGNTFVAGGLTYDIISRSPAQTWTIRCRESGQMLENFSPEKYIINNEAAYRLYHGKPSHEA